jgi:signal peptidase II
MSRESFASFKWLWITALVVILDYFTKQWASSAFEYAQSLEVLPIFDLTLLHNTGAAFSFLAEAGGWQRWFFTIIALSVSTVLLVWMSRLSPKQRWLNIALALILGGALGNLYDRLAYGYVIDFYIFIGNSTIFQRSTLLIQPLL